jgi:putative nucleotidyltransferase with HDIG domain
MVQPFVKTVSPSSEGVMAHCRRTAAVAKLIAHHCFLPSEEKDLLHSTCLQHHCSTGLLEPKTLARLLTGIFRETARVPDDPIPVAARGVLDACEAPGSGTELESKLASILRLADAFDQDMEAQPIEGYEVVEILDRLRSGVDAGLWPEAFLNALVEATRPPAIGAPESWRVPVFPHAALHALGLMRGAEAKLDDVVEAASLDPVIAGLVMQLANSALFGSRSRISTLSQAIGRLGFTNAKKVITSAALRPMFSPARLQDAWQHSLEIADLSEQLARHAGTPDPAEAYLAGLVHDVGRIALLSMPLYDSARLHGLVSGGCPPLYAESLVLRTDHAEMGAKISEGWRLPEMMVSAIRQHHRPEKADNPLGHMLYLAEYLSGSEEDLPSVIRLEASLKGSGLTFAAASSCTVSALGSWLAAA